MIESFNNVPSSEINLRGSNSWNGSDKKVEYIENCPVDYVATYHIGDKLIVQQWGM